MAGNRIHAIGVLMASAAGALATVPASASDRQVYRFDLPAQDLGDALRTIAAKAGWELYASADDVNGVAAPSVHGSFTPRQAIEQLVRGTNLSVRFEKGAVIVRGRSQTTVTDIALSRDIVVTGSRISGGLTTAPVTVITSADMRRAGQADLGEALRSSPLNFGGGQNPGIGTNQGAANVNVNGASSVNLLGLGPNATLTLLDGNRLSYTGINAAVDISAIPAIAVDRIEIIADGASAIYGSDAVAGVVNVRLRRDYDGVSIMGRIGGTTDGGGFQQQYNAVAGQVWRNGGVLFAYDYLSNAPIYARDRSYTAKMASDATLYPQLNRHSALVSAFYDLNERVSASVDLVFKDTRQDIVQGYVSGQSYLSNGADAHSASRTFSLAPNLSVQLGGGWTARLISSYAIDNTRIHSSVYARGAITSTGLRRYDNSSLSAEIGAEGPLFELPAGAVRAAFGAGYRRTAIDLASSNAGAINAAFDQSRNNVFGYGELNVPLLSAAQESAFGRSLIVTGAFRYETNTGVGSVAVPKLGISYAPIEGVTLKGSWGRSFRLPTLYQQYSGYFAVLLPAAGYGTGFPANAAFIGLTGASPNLKPERSQNWTISAEFKPARIPRLTGNVSYFHFNYTDRIATPVASILGALNNPLYASLITLDPSTTVQQAQVAGATLGLQNGTGAPYNPANVVAILDIRDRNVGRQTFHGIDLSLRYGMTIGSDRTLDLSFDGILIDSDQQLRPGLPITELSGTIFNPPHLKGRAGITYATDTLSISGFANLSSRLTDNRTPTAYKISGLSTFDLAAQFKAGEGFELGATVNNVFNQKPDTIVTGSAYESTFDTTNFSPLGRLIAVSLRKSW